MFIYRVIQKGGHKLETYRVIQKILSALYCRIFSKCCPLNKSNSFADYLPVIHSGQSSSTWTNNK